MPTRLSNKIQRITKPTKFHATVIDVAGSRISVQCGSGGPKLKNLVFTGSVELGNQVIVQWDGDAPVVIAPTHAQYDSLSSEQEESSVVGSLEDIDDDATTYDPDHTHEEDDITDLEHSAIKLQGKDIPEAVAGDDGKVYVYNASLDAFVLSIGGGGAAELSDLSDVNTATPTNRHALLADGTDWESRAIVEADVSDLSHTDSDAIHDNVAAEISAISEKASPVDADLVLIEDSADSNNKKKVQLGNLPSNTVNNLAFSWMGF